jgi:hypothetical protein
MSIEIDSIGLPWERDVVEFCLLECGGEVLTPHFRLLASRACRAYTFDFVGHLRPVVGAREFMVDSVALYVQHCFVLRLNECQSLAFRDEYPRPA